jgi:hypothetical protein
MKQRRKCFIPQCEEIIFAKNLCRKHYQKHLEDTSPKRCSLEDCDRVVYGNNLCKKHYERERRRKLREKNKGGTVIHFFRILLLYVLPIHR